jgi:hypothetical protein
MPTRRMKLGDLLVWPLCNLRLQDLRKFLEHISPLHPPSRIRHTLELLARPNLEIRDILVKTLTPVVQSIDLTNNLPRHLRPKSLSQ